MSRSTIYFDGQVADGIDLSHEEFDGYLGMRGVEADGRIDLHCASTQGIASLKYATLTEKLHGWGFDVGSVLQMEWATINDDAFLRGGSAREVRGRGLTVDGRLDLGGFDADRYDLRDTTLGTLRLERTDTTIDLRGATVDELRVDDLSRYEMRVDEKTWIGTVDEGPQRLGESVNLTDREYDLLDSIHERPLFPPTRRDGCTFTYDDLKWDFAMSYHHPVFMNLVQKGAIERLDDAYYMARTDPL